MSQSLVIFDLDGTLIDTAPDLINSLNHAITQAELEPVSFDDLTYLVGHGAKVMINRAFELRKKLLSPETEAWMFDEFLVHYRDQMPGQSVPFPNLVSTLDTLRGAGMQLAVCTNKTEALARTLLDRLELTPYFSAITGGDTFAVRKPDKGHILGTIEQSGNMSSRAIMIGDSVNDIKAAANAEVPSVAVTFGYSDVPVEDLNPDHIISDFAELTPALVKTLLDAK